MGDKKEHSWKYSNPKKPKITITLKNSREKEIQKTVLYEEKDGELLIRLDLGSKYSSNDEIINQVGDVNDDGVIDAKDAVEVLRHVVGLPPADQFIQDCADVSKNGSITAYDAALIMQKVAGLIEEF